MNQDIERFLNLKAPPARLTAEQVAWMLGFSAHEIPILVTQKLLKPLGHPAHNGQKYFFAATVEDLRRDEKWFSRASDAIVQYWRYRNSRKGKKSPETQQSPDKNTDAADVAEIQN